MKSATGRPASPLPKLNEAQATVASAQPAPIRDEAERQRGTGTNQQSAIPTIGFLSFFVVVICHYGLTKVTLGFY